MRSQRLTIRLAVLEADYSTALTLLLRYPAPDSPVSLVDDAMYLRDNLSPEGGKYIIIKYSKRAPSTRQPRPPAAKKLRNPRRTLSPSMKPLFQPGQIESIVQDVAKNVLDRSEKWGVNRAVREAVVEVRKNVQGYQGKQLPPSTREEVLEKQNLDLTKRLQALEERRRQLARILDTSLGVLANDAMGPAEKEDAMKRLAHVKDCLLDEQRPLDRDLLQPASAASSPTSRKASLAAARKPKPPPPDASPPGPFVKTSFKNNSDPDFISLAQRPRATLAQSSFAWMLGDDPVVKHRSAFVASGTKSSGGTAASAAAALSKKSSERTLKKTPTTTVGKSDLGTLVDSAEDEGFDLGSFRK
jgi:TBC1 domain family protein 5